MNHESKAVQKHKKTTDIEVTRDHPVFAPATDIYEKSDAVMVVCDIPGVDKKNVDVMLENGVLTITGRQDTTEPEDCKLLQRGYRSGVFRRTFNVTADIDMSKINAEISKGVLRLMLPKTVKAQPRKIVVTGE